MQELYEIGGLVGAFYQKPVLGFRGTDEAEKLSLSRKPYSE